MKPALRFWRFDASAGRWADETTGAAAPSSAGGGSGGGAVGVGEDVAVSAVWPDDSDDVWMWRDGYLCPQTLELASAASGCAAPEALKAMPAMFDADGLVVEQHFATSKDGTKVPFFVIMREGLARDGSHATLLDAYGGFEISMLPGYSGGVGVGWLERGGVKVVANIRGGGEYGPSWHQAALKEKRYKAYEDLEAVAAALCHDLELTRRDKLAVIGGSNGGLLVGKGWGGDEGRASRYAGAHPHACSSRLLCCLLRGQG